MATYMKSRNLNNLDLGFPGQNGFVHIWIEIEKCSVVYALHPYVHSRDTNRLYDNHVLTSVDVCSNQHYISVSQLS